jgi:hypothetical protein
LWAHEFGRNSKMHLRYREPAMTDGDGLCRNGGKCPLPGQLFSLRCFDCPYRIATPSPTRDGAEGAGDDLPPNAEHPANYRKAFAQEQQSRDAAEGAGDVDALAEIWRICDRAGEYSKPKLAAAIASIVEARTKARAAAPPKPAPDTRTATLLRNAALFLELGARYAPNEAASDRNAATGELLKTRGLADVMKSVAAECAAFEAAPCFDCGKRDPCDDSCPNHITPSPAGAAEPWTTFRFVQVAFAEFKEHELRNIVEAISKNLTAIPPVRGEREDDRTGLNVNILTSSGDGGEKTDASPKGDATSSPSQG